MEKYNNILMLLLFINLLFTFYLFYKINNLEHFTSSGPSITDQIKQIYQADVQAIRNLSTIAASLISNNGATVPGNLTISGDLAINGSITNIINAKKAGMLVGYQYSDNRIATGQEGGIFSGEGDEVSSTVNNVSINSWNGIGFKTTCPGQPTSGKYGIYFDTRNGFIHCRGIKIYHGEGIKIYNKDGKHISAMDEGGQIWANGNVGVWDGGNWKTRLDPDGRIDTGPIHANTVNANGIDCTGQVSANTVKTSGINCTGQVSANTVKTNGIDCSTGQVAANNVLIGNGYNIMTGSFRTNSNKDFNGLFINSCSKGMALCQCGNSGNKNELFGQWSN